MQTEEFIKAVFEQKENRAAQIVKFLENVPGRKPRQRTLEMSALYKSLDSENKEKLKNLIDYVIDSTLFSFFCILDHVSFLEDTEEKSVFELYAIKDGVRTLINDPKKEELHNLYNDYALPQE